MNGKLDPEERVMSSEVPAYRKACAVMKSVSSDVTDTISKLGWDCYDDVVVEIGGTQVSGIDVGEEYNKKWQSPIGTRKYNKDAFIIIKIYPAVRSALRNHLRKESSKPQHTLETKSDET